MSSDGVLYVRNSRPNAVLMRVEGLKITVERRGSREDTAALPGDWRNNPQVATFLQRGILEEISKDAFMALSGRPEETFVEERGRPKRVPGPTEVPLVQRPSDAINIPINPEDHRQPTVITDETLRKSLHLRSPRPEFAGEVPTTSEDLQRIEEARKAAEANPGRVDFPEDETEQLKLQVAELTGLVQQLLAKGETAEVTPAPKKKATPKKTAKKAAPKKVKRDADPMSPEGKEEYTSRDLME